MTTFYVLLTLSIIAFGVLRGWIERTGAVLPVLAQAEQADLLEAVREAATEPRMRITLSGFWRGRAWNRRQQYCLLRPLIQRRVLHIPESPDVPTQVLRAVWYGVLAQPPGAVQLNLRDWTRMATDASGRVPNIIVGDISGGTNQIGGTQNFLSQQDAAADQIAALVRALLDDARRTPEVAEDALHIAEGIEADHAQGRMGAVHNWIAAAAKLVNTSAAAMESTHKVLRTLGLLE